jgi:hypothetical protein
MNRCHVAVALPACLLAAVACGMLGVAVFDSHPRWSNETLNLSEAALAADTAQVARLIEEGQDVNARRPIRLGASGPDVPLLTPLEAAVSERRPELVTFLVGRGARPDAATLPRLWCDAVAGGDRDVIAALEPVRPAGAVECGTVGP